MRQTFNYRHLYYFWVVAKEGGITRGAARLNMAVQTVSAQVRELEQALGHALLKPEGRGVALTEAGQVAMCQADQIFALGEQLPDLVRNVALTPAVRLAVGVSETLPKLLVHRLLQPVLATPGLRLHCQEADFDDMLAALALHRLDVVLADRPAPANPSLKLYNHPLGRSQIAWYAAESLVEQAKQGFPASLAQVPVLLPTTHAAIRLPLDAWFERHGLRPNIVGEFEDSALLKTFGASGMGIFPAAEWIHDDLLGRFKLEQIGLCDGVDERFYAIDTQKKVLHPLVQRLIP